MMHIYDVCNVCWIKKRVFLQIFIFASSLPLRAMLCVLPYDTPHLSTKLTMMTIHSHSDHGRWGRHWHVLQQSVQCGSPSCSLYPACRYRVPPLLIKWTISHLANRKRLRSPVLALRAQLFDPSRIIWLPLGCSLALLSVICWWHQQCETKVRTWTWSKGVLIKRFA